MLNNSDRYLDLKRLSEASSLSVRKLRSLIKHEGLPIFRVGQKILVYWPDFLEWMQSKKEKKPDIRTRELAGEILEHFRS